MKRWDLHEIPTPEGTRSPVVLHSQDGEGRVVLIRIDAGQELGEHQVKEAALLLVVEGEVTVEAGDESVDAEAGALFRFDPDDYALGAASISAIDTGVPTSATTDYFGTPRPRHGDYDIGAFEH